MRYYFDTSSLRKASNKLPVNNENIYTSGLAMFELISGMTQNDYCTRKTIINNVVNSGIAIDWDSYKMKMHKAFQLSYSDIEGKSIKKMVDIILKSSSFQELEREKVYFTEHDYYKLESFSGLDDEISKMGIEESKWGITEWRKEYDKFHRKGINQELFNNESFRSFVYSAAELKFMSFLEDITQTKRPSTEYFKALEKYDKSLELFFLCGQIRYSLAQLKGMQYAKNDTLDILHTIYVSKETIMVSDDKIFKDLSNWCSGFTCLNLNEFFEEVQ